MPAHSSPPAATPHEPPVTFGDEWLRSVLHTLPVRPGDSVQDTAISRDAALVALDSFNARDPFEAMLAGEIIATHNGVMEAFRHAAAPELLPELVCRLHGKAVSMMRLLTTLVGHLQESRMRPSGSPLASLADMRELVRQQDAARQQHPMPSEPTGVAAAAPAAQGATAMAASSPQHKAAASGAAMAAPADPATPPPAAPPAAPAAAAPATAAAPHAAAATAAAPHTMPQHKPPMSSEQHANHAAASPVTPAAAAAPSAMPAAAAAPQVQPPRKHPTPGGVPATLAAVPPAAMAAALASHTAAAKAPHVQ
jgi:hypothetical protein